MKKQQQTTETAIAGSNMLAEVFRPKYAGEALNLLKEDKIIEIESQYAFDLMRYVQQKESNFKFTCRVNELNEGWTVIQHCR